MEALAYPEGFSDHLEFRLKHNQPWRITCASIVKQCWIWGGFGSMIGAPCSTLKTVCFAKFFTGLTFASNKAGTIFPVPGTSDVMLCCIPHGFCKNHSINQLCCWGCGCKDCSNVSLNHPRPSASPYHGICDVSRFSPRFDWIFFGEALNLLSRIFSLQRFATFLQPPPQLFSKPPINFL